MTPRITQTVVACCLSAAGLVSGAWLIWKALLEMRAALTLPNGRGVLS